MATISMKCKSCSGVLDVDEDREIMFCPYCGSKELVLESDEVKKERIKYKTYKDVRLNELEHEEKLSKIESANRIEEKKAEFADDVKRLTVQIVGYVLLGIIVYAFANLFLK